MRVHVRRRLQLDSNELFAIFFIHISNNIQLQVHNSCRYFDQLRFQFN